MDPRAKVIPYSTISWFEKVSIFADGSCLNSPGPGGYSAILHDDAHALHDRTHEKTLSGGFRCTTNDRMELMSPIKGIEALKQRCKVTVYTKSKYVVESTQKRRIQHWEENRWLNRMGRKICNVDLLVKLLDVCREHRVRFVWIGNHVKMKELMRNHNLANVTAGQENLSVDLGYEQL